MKHLVKLHPIKFTKPGASERSIGHGDRNTPFRQFNGSRDAFKIKCFLRSSILTGISMLSDRCGPPVSGSSTHSVFPSLEFMVSLLLIGTSVRSEHTKVQLVGVAFHQAEHALGWKARLDYAALRSRDKWASSSMIRVMNIVFLELPVRLAAVIEMDQEMHRPNQ